MTSPKKSSKVRILEKFKGIKKIANIKSWRKKIFISHIRHGKGEIGASTKSTANTLAKSYVDLYSGEQPQDDKEQDEEQDGEEAVLKCDGPGKSEKPIEQKRDNFEEVDKCESREKKSDHISELTKHDLRIAPTPKKKGNAGDTKCIKAEDDETREMMGDIFNEIIKQESMAPSNLRKVLIKVLYKKDDATRPKNYRPICTVSTLYKVWYQHVGRRDRLCKSPCGVTSDVVAMFEGGDKMTGAHTASSHGDKTNRKHMVGALLQIHPGLCGTLLGPGRTPTEYHCPQGETVGGPNSRTGAYRSHDVSHLHAHAPRATLTEGSGFVTTP